MGIMIINHVLCLDPPVQVDIPQFPDCHTCNFNLQGDYDTKYSSDYDWWTKYYSSIGETSKVQLGYVEEGHDHLKVYGRELELEESFNNFTDFVQTFALHRGRGSRDPEDMIGQPVGYFKGAVKVYPIPEDQSEPIPKMIFSNMSTNAANLVDVIVRVYIIKARIESI